MHLRALLAETAGTFIILAIFFAVWLIVPGAAKSAWQPAMAIGLAATAATYALGQVSGGHFNPAITVGLVAGGRFDAAQAPMFVVAQLAGAALAVGFIIILQLQAPVSAGSLPDSFAGIANSFGGRGEAGLLSALACEIILTAILVIVFMGATAHTSLAPMAPVAVGLGMAACYLVAIPLTNGGLNPARSTVTALIAGPHHIASLWIFWLAPIAGACLGGLLARYLHANG